MIVHNNEKKDNPENWKAKRQNSMYPRMRRCASMYVVKTSKEKAINKLLKYDEDFKPAAKSKCIISKNSMVFFEILCFFSHKDLMKSQGINRRFYGVLVPFAMQEAYMLTSMPS